MKEGTKQVKIFFVSMSGKTLAGFRHFEKYLLHAPSMEQAIRLARKKSKDFDRPKTCMIDSAEYVGETEN